MFAKLRKMNRWEWLTIAVIIALLAWEQWPWGKPLVIAIEGDEVTEEVRQVFFRTEKLHDGCLKGGFLRVCGQPERIEAYGINKAVWPHRCSGCGQTNMIYDARWPQIKAEWRAVK